MLVEPLTHSQRWLFSEATQADMAFAGDSAGFELPPPDVAAITTTTIAKTTNAKFRCDFFISTFAARTDLPLKIAAT